MNPRVKKINILGNYKLHLVFTNDEEGEFDCSHLLEFGVFKELKDKNYFDKARVEFGTVAWPHEQDICPDTLYVDSEKMCQPVN